MQLPKETLSNFVENSYGRIKSQFISAIERGKKRFIFSGAYGTGKTFLAKAFANDSGLDFKETNLYTLEYGDEDDVSKVFYSYITQEAVSTSLFSQKKKLLYITDIEKLMKVNPSILKRIKDISDTVIVFESHGSDIFRADSRQFISDYIIINFYKINAKNVDLYLRKVAAMNSINISGAKLAEIAANSDGNIMSAITDLEFYYTTGGVIPIHRNPDSNIFARLNSIFSGNVSSVDTYLSSQQEVKVFEIWLAEKIPLVFEGHSLYMAFEYLSFSDLLLNKIKAQNWVFLKYIRFLLFDAIGSLSNGMPARVDYSGPKWNLYY